MQPISRTLVKNIVVAVTLGLAALAAWAVTESHAPAIEISSLGSQQG